jgi:hypothetical protein
MRLRPRRVRDRHGGFGFEDEPTDIIRGLLREHDRLIEAAGQLGLPPDELRSSIQTYWRMVHHGPNKEPPKPDWLDASSS